MAAQLILNRYRPIREAGAGGFGTVQVAWDTRIQRKVAIKCLELTESDAARAAMPGGPPPGQAFPVWDEELGFIGRDGFPLTGAEAPSDPGFLDALDDAHGRAGETAEERWLAHVPGLDEARTAAMLSDPNIVAVYDFEIQGTTAYLIMEYVEGLTLTQLLRRFDDRLTLDIVAAVFLDVSHALEVAHANQVLHLDIKPDNILINRQGQVKVTDFGLATLADAGGIGTTGGGTIGYMPLEQMRQEGLDARCDEWALASVTYEMLAGENPFLAPDLDRAEAAIEDAELALPSLCWDGLDAGIDDVLFFALDPDCEERYASVADFAEELEPFLGDAKRGHRELAVLVGGAEEEGEGQPEGGSARQRTPLLERIGWRERTVAAHVLGAAAAALLGFVGLANVPQASGWDNPLFWGLLALCILGGALKPHLGALLGCCALTAGLFAQQAYAAGCVLVVAAAVWWFFVGRLGNAQANTALAFPLCGAFGLAPAGPLAAGFCLRVLPALGTAAFGACLAVILGGLGSGGMAGWDVLANWSFEGRDVQAGIIGMLVQPGTWCVAASWLAAAAVVAACCSRGARWLAAVGCVLGTALLAAGACAAAFFASGMASWAPEPLALAAVLVPGALMTAASCLGVPERLCPEGGYGEAVS